MIYPVYVHLGDDQHAFGLTIPDFPGCFSAADSWDQIPKAVQEAIELYCEGEDMVIPSPTPLSELIALNAPDYQDGNWLLIDIDLGAINTKVIRINVSLPESLVHQIDQFAKSQHMSRSAFLAMSAQRQLIAGE